MTEKSQAAGCILDIKNKLIHTLQKLFISLRDMQLTKHI